jgi:hypothetical protein
MIRRVCVFWPERMARTIGALNRIGRSFMLHRLSYSSARQ